MITKSYIPLTGRRALSRIFSLLARESSSISTVARSIMDGTTYKLPCTCTVHLSMGMAFFLRTSTMVLDISNGSRPRLMVRLAWLSRSTSSTFFPSPARAAPRLWAVVVFATPPFWLAMAITCIGAPFRYITYILYISL